MKKHRFLWTETVNYVGDTNELQIWDSLYCYWVGDKFNFIPISANYYLLFWCIYAIFSGIHLFYRVSQSILHFRAPNGEKAQGEESIELEM